MASQMMVADSTGASPARNTLSRESATGLGGRCLGGATVPRALGSQNCFSRPDGCKIEISNVRVLLDVATKVRLTHGIAGIALLSVVVLDPGKIQRKRLHNGIAAAAGTASLD